MYGAHLPTPRQLLVPVMLVLLVGWCLAVGAGPASASHVSCGDTITADTTLDSDLDCSDLSGAPALTIGADGVRLDLNGHTVSSACEVDCAGTAVIDDRAGYDSVRILDGTIRPNGAGAGVVLVGVDASALEGLTIAGFPRPRGQPGVGILLSDSGRNGLGNSTITGGDPALLLSGSDRNQISRTSIDGGIDIHIGDGIGLEDGSDHNHVVDSRVNGEGIGIGISRRGGFELDSSMAPSVGNSVTRSSVGGYFGCILGFRAHRSVISHNSLDESRGRSSQMTSSDETVIRHNEVGAGLEIAGDRNRVAHNDISIFSWGFVVLQGDANRIRKNRVRGGIEDGIAVASAASNTLVAGNRVTGAFDDGIDVDAPGTIIRANTAIDNGDLGIEAVAGVIDGGGNKASGNGNPAQCTNIFCR